MRRRIGAPRRFVALAALSAAAAIGFGAFAAHGAEPARAEWLKTGGLYLLFHAVAALALSGAPGIRFARGPAALMLAGAWIFAASLFAMGLGAPRWLGAVTPVGGTVMIAAWLWLALRAVR